MALSIQYIDSAAYNFYALIFKSTGSVWRQSTQAFTSYTDSNIALFALEFAEDANRAGYYTCTASGSNLDLTNDRLTVEIYERVGGSPVKSADLLKASQSFVWDGNREFDDYDRPRLYGGGYLGTFASGTNLIFMVHCTNIYGEIYSLSSPRWDLYDKNGAAVISNTGLSVYNTFYGNIYSGSVPVGNPLNPGQDYHIIVGGSVNSISVTTQFYFSVSSGLAIPNININANDVIGAMGYATGTVMSNITTTGFVTNLTNAYNNAYCGQILIIPSGDYKGYGSIIGGYDGTTKTVLLYKALHTPPTVGTNFIIYPIGGNYVFS